MISLFCKHDWNVHSKEKYEWDETTAVKGTEHWYAPKWEHSHISETVEILICKKCGKVKKVVY